MSRVAPLLLFSVLGIAASLSLATPAEAAPIRDVGNSQQITAGGGGVIIVQNVMPGNGGVIIVQN